MIRELEGMLAEITGFDAVSLQPNAGSAGEYAGLLAIRDYHLGAWSRASQCLFDSFVGARNKSRKCRDGRNESRRRQMR